MEAGEEDSTTMRREWQQLRDEVVEEEEQDQEDRGDEQPGFRKSGHLGSSAQQRNYRRHSPSLSRSSSPSLPEAVGKRGRSLSPRKPVGNATTIDHSRKARRVESDNDVEKDEVLRSRHGAREPSSSALVDSGKVDTNARSRQQSENQDHGYSSRSAVSGRRYYGNSRQGDSRSDKEKDSQAGSDRWKDPIVERNRARDRDKDFERDFYGKGREHHDRGWSRDKDRERERERYRDKDRERGKESSYGGRDYFGTDNDVRRDKEKDRARDRDREKSRAYRTPYNDADESQDRDKYSSRYDHRGRDRDHYREKDAAKESERERTRYKDDRKQKDLSKEKSDHIKRDFSREEDVHERDKLKDGGEHSSQHHAQGKEKLSGARVGNVSSRDMRDDKYHNSPRDIAERSAKDVFTGEKKEGKSKSQVLKDLIIDDSEAVHKSASGRPDIDNQHSEPRQDPTSKVSNVDAKSSKSSKWGPESQLKSGNTSENASAEDLANDLSTAKIAAMKAAELVNKNLGVAGFMSADQKKKLLWGSKKAQPDQETGVAAGTNRWDTVHFQDRGRQEKFNKLMGVKAEAKADSSSQATGDASLFTEEKQRELQQDLEKQFTAGLRRRDGRTVGLGL